MQAGAITPGRESISPEVSDITPEDTIGRLLDHLHETQRLFDECRSNLADPKGSDLVDILHDCEQLVRSQIHLLTRARQRLK